MKTNPILEEIRAVRDKESAQVQNDVHRLFAILRSETETLHRQGRLRLRPADATTVARVSLREEAPEEKKS